MTKIVIDIISDVICPWCFIGKRRLERAMKQFSMSRHGETEFAVSWHPFYLAPPESPIMSKMERYRQKFGAERVARMIPFMREVGAREGIAFDYGGPIGPTTLPHRVIQYVSMREPADLDRVVETLFESYFERQGNVFTVPALLDLMRQVPLEAGPLETWLRDGEGEAEMNRLAEQSRDQGIDGVPFFTINGKYRLSGAQEAEAFIEIFEKIVS